MFSENHPKIAWVELKQFYVHCLESRESDPLLVVRDGITLDANTPALDRGVQLQMSLRQAQAILQGGEFIEWKRQDYAKKQRAWLEVCTDYSSTIEPADQHAAWLDLSLHADVWDIVSRLSEELSSNFGLSSAIGVASAKWLARIAARFDQDGSALREPNTFLSPLSILHLDPVPIEHREKLIFLGYTTIGSVAALPIRALKSQFGEEAYLIHDAANGRLSEEVQAIYPRDALNESVQFEHGIDSMESVLHICTRMSQRLGTKLISRGIEGNRMRVKLEFRDAKPLQVARNFTKPIRCARTVLAAVGLLLEGRVQDSLVALKILLSDLRPVASYQPTLISTAAETRGRRLAASVHHIRTVFGDGSMKTGKEIILPRRVRVLREWKDATGWR